AQVSRVLGDADFLVNGTVTHSDGFRQHARQQAEQFNANVGWRLGPNAETRFYFGAYIVDQQLPGTLSLSEALNNPRKAAPTALSGDQARNSRTERIANVTSFRLEVGQLDIASWAIHKNLYHPIFQVIDQGGWTYGVAPRYTADFEIGGFRDQVIAGARFIGGNNTALQFVNIGGARGAKTVDSAQNAYNYEAYAENRFFFLPTVALMTGAKFLHDERVFEDNGGTPGHSALIASRNYDGINPKLGLLWVPRPDIQVFADVTRSLDVPDFTDLVQSSFSTTRFVPLQAQRAWTAEVGTRGRYDRFAWNITLFRSLVRDELMQFTLAPGIPANTFNAPRTLHQGIEFGGSVELLRGLFAADDTIKLTQVWNYSDFRFENDPVFGNNRLAAIPQHVLRTVIHYAHPSGFYFAPTLDWVPRGPWADYANTLRVPAYALLGLQTGVQFSNGLLLFAEARNLTDKRHVSDLSTIANAAAPGANTAIFYPGDGRSVYAGARYAF
ncbi:MAG TPA: TonB-dependent receptor, partial [Xanthobacteraceae bacterium]